MSNNNKIVVSNRYSEASIKFRMAWAEYIDHEDRVKYEIVNLVKILEHDGFSRMQAIKKIVNDHKDLPGFSKNSIYRELPEDMKNKQLGRPNFPFGKLGSTNKIQESQALKDFRDKKGTKEQPETIIGGIQVEDQNLTADMDVTYDSNFVNSLIAENEQLKIENFRLKKDYQELETKYNEVTEPYQVKDSIIVNDQEIPLIITVDPFMRTITVEVDQKEVKKLNRF